MLVLPSAGDTGPTWLPSASNVAHVREALKFLLYFIEIQI